MTFSVRDEVGRDRLRGVDETAGSGTSPAGAPVRCELSSGSALSLADIEQIVAKAGLAGRLSDPARQSALAFVEHSGRKYKVLAYASAAAARQRLTLLGRTGDLFAACLGRVENCLVHEFVEGSGEAGNSHLGDDIGSFLADLAGFAVEPMHEPDFEAWSRTLAEKGIFLRRTIGTLRRYIAGALVVPVRWDLEYLDAVPKNFVYAGKRRLICVDSKHLHPGPQGVSLAKLYSNIGEYCRREDYTAIRNVYQNRVRDNRLDDPAYFEFLLLFYSLFFLVANAGQFSWKMNVENGMNRVRKKTVLGIIGTSRSIRLLEGLWWSAAFDWFWVSKLPRRALRYALRRAGGGKGINKR
jgi:hypothetical protein